MIDFFLDKPSASSVSHDLNHPDHALVVKDLSVAYRTHLALEKVSGYITKGSLTAIVGPNGGGKSTFLKTLMNFVPSSAGTIQISQDYEKSIAYLPQQSEIDKTFPLTVRDVVALGNCQHQGFFKAFQPSGQSDIDRHIKEVGMSGFGHKNLSTLSGGQFQRVLFARLAMQEGDLILLDEPFTSIDGYTVIDLMKIIKKWHKQGKTILVVCHDLELVHEHFPQTLFLARKVIGWGDTKEVLTAENLRRATRIAHNLDTLTHTELNNFEESEEG